MTDPLAADPQVQRALRYTELGHRDRAFTTVSFLKRTGAFTDGMKARELTQEEAMQLTDEDFGA